MKMIITSECEKCIYAIIDDSMKAKIRGHCKYKNKKYYWGQCVPCEYMETKKEVGI